MRRLRTWRTLDISSMRHSVYSCPSKGRRENEFSKKSKEFSNSNDTRDEYDALCIDKVEQTNSDE